MKDFGCSEREIHLEDLVRINFPISNVAEFARIQLETLLIGALPELL
jgi:hypothetical protein